MNFLLNSTVKANITLNDTQQWPKAAEAFTFLFKNGVVDLVCAQVIDVSVEILRKHRLFGTGPSRRFSLMHLADAVLMRFSAGVL